MAPELVVTPGGYRPPEMVHKIGRDLMLRILTGRMQGVDASDTPVADYGSIPRDGENPALTPGYALPPGIDTPEGSEPTASFGRGWIAFAHWRNEGNEPISSFRSTLSVPPEPETRSGQTVFLFPAMQDPIPMTLVPALQWGPSAAGGGEYWSVASWYVGGTTGAVFHGELVPVNAGDELTAFFDLVRRQRAHFDYRCGFEGLSEADLPVYRVRELSRCGEVLAAYGIKQCTDYPAANATGFRDIELVTGFRRPPLAWNPVNTITDCGQHVVVLSDANPGGEVDVHYRQIPGMPAVEPEAAVAEAAPEEVAAPALVGAALAASVEPEEAAWPEPAEAEAVPEEVAAAAEAIPEPEPIAAEAEIAPEEVETPLLVAAAIEEPQPELAPAEAAPVEAAAAEVAPEEVEAAPEEVEAVPPVTAVPEPVAATAPEPAAAALLPEPAVAALPNLEVHPRIDRLVEITIHNHSPDGATAGALEARVASLESTMAALAQMIASSAQPHPGAAVDGDLAARLERLVQLKGSGVLDDTEFAAAKSQLIGVRVEFNGSSVTPETVR
jgi:hypothetical protein